MNSGVKFDQRRRPQEEPSKKAPVTPAKVQKTVRDSS